MHWEFRTFDDAQVGTVFNVYPCAQNKGTPPSTLVLGSVVWVVNNDERVPAEVLKADRREILLASAKLPTLRLEQVSGGNRRFGRVGPSMYS